MNTIPEEDTAINKAPRYVFQEEFSPTKYFPNMYELRTPIKDKRLNTIVDTLCIL